MLKPIENRTYPRACEGNNPGCYHSVKFVCLSASQSVRRNGPLPQSLRPCKSLVKKRETGFVCLVILLWHCGHLFRFKINCKGQNVPRTRDSKSRKVEARTQEKALLDAEVLDAIYRQPLEEHKSMRSRYVRFFFLCHCILFILQIDLIHKWLPI